MWSVDTHTQAEGGHGVSCFTVSLFCSFETRSLAEARARLVASEPQPSSSLFPTGLGFWVPVVMPDFIYIRMLGPESRSSGL